MVIRSAITRVKLQLIVTTPVDAMKIKVLFIIAG